MLPDTPHGDDGDTVHEQEMGFGVFIGGGAALGPGASKKPPAVSA